jgi:hypothetical protein
VETLCFTRVDIGPAFGVSARRLEGCAGEIHRFVSRHHTTQAS